MHGIKVLTSRMASKFRQFPVVYEDIEIEWLLFRSAVVSLAVKSGGQNWLKIGNG